MRRLTALTVSAALAGGIALAPAFMAPAAFAKDGDSKARGTCSASSTYAAKVKDRRGGLRVDFWVKNNTIGQTWAYTLTQGGTTVDSSTKATRATDDSSSDDTRHTAEVKWRTSLPSSVGALVFTAKSTSGPAETCTTTLAR